MQNIKTNTKYMYIYKVDIEASKTRRLQLCNRMTEKWFCSCSDAFSSPLLSEQVDSKFKNILSSCVLRQFGAFHEMDSMSFHASSAKVDMTFRRFWIELKSAFFSLSDTFFLLFSSSSFSSTSSYSSSQLRLRDERPVRDSQSLLPFDCLQLCNRLPNEFVNPRGVRGTLREFSLWSALLLNELP